MIRVVSENGAPVGPAVTINPELVAHLERLLNLARDGQLQTIAFAATGPHKMDRGYCGIEDAGDGVLLLGILTRVSRLVHERTDTLSESVAEFPVP